MSPALGKFDGNVTVIPFNFIPGAGIGPPGGPPGVGGVTTLLTPPAFPILETPPRPLPPPLPANAVTLTAAPVGTALVGDNVTFTALASGGSGSYEYQFMAKVAPAGPFVVGQAYGPSATWIWTTTAAPPGYLGIPGVRAQRRVPCRRRSGQHARLHPDGSVTISVGLMRRR